jgi:hypothetical protein
MKNWLRNKMHNFIFPQDEAPQTNKVSRKGIGISVDESIDNERALRFNVYNASGGRVVETNRYDRVKDRHIRGLYVITSDMDFGHEIDKIMTMEALK